MGTRKISAYLAIYLFWGASFLAIRNVVAVSPPFFSAGVRFVLAGLILLTFARARGMAMPAPEQWRSIVLLSLLFFVFNYGAVFWAEQHIPSAEAAVIGATIPSAVFLLEWLLLREIKPHWLSFAGALTGFCGVCWLVFSAPPTAITGAKVQIDRYALACLAAAFVWALATIISKRMPLPADRPISAGLQMLVGGFVLLLVGALRGEFHRLTPAILRAPVLGAMAYLVLLASVAAFSAYIYLLSVEPASRVASYAYVNPIIAVGLGAWLAGERLRPAQLAAAALVIAGTAATLLGRGRRTAGDPAI